MALLDPPACLRPVLEADQLLAAVAAEDLRGDRGIRDQGPPDRGGIAVGDEQDTIEGNRVTRRGFETLDLELRADLDAVLLSAGLDDCVHGSPGAWSRSRGGTPQRVGRKRRLGCRGEIRNCTARAR